MENMTDRGSTRPEMKKQEQNGEMQEMMSPEHKMEMLRMHHQKTLWIYWTVVMLGVWMMAAPATFDYASAATTPAGGREVWLSLTRRADAPAWSDLLSEFFWSFSGGARLPRTALSAFGAPASSAYGSIWLRNRWARGTD